MTVRCGGGEMFVADLIVMLRCGGVGCMGQI